MPDDATTRKRRSRAHSRGDHSLCLPGRCSAAVAPEPPAPAPEPRAAAPEPVTDPPDAGPSGEVAQSIASWAEALNVTPDDPRAPLLAAARTLAEHLDDGRDPAAIARELRTVVAWIADADQGDQLDELRARRAGRRVEMLVGRSG